MFVATDRLTKCYGTISALRDCTFQVSEGEIFGLLGPNGSGKTTLLRLLLGFLRPTAGRAEIEGLDCYRDSVSVHRRLSYLPGEVRLPRRMQGRDVLQFFSRVRPGGDLARALALARRLELDLTRQVARSSTGMRQMLSVCIAFSTDAALLVLDEPTANLDPSVRAEVLALARSAREEGRTVIFCSHVLSEVEEVCDRVAIMRRGRLVHEQVVADLRRQHRIRARLAGPLGPLPDAVRQQVALFHSENGRVEIDAPGELSTLLGWLSTLPISEVRIEPLGLRAIYDRCQQERDHD